MLAIEPAGDDGGNEELGAIAKETACQCRPLKNAIHCLRVRTRISH